MCRRFADFAGVCQLEQKRALKYKSRWKKLNKIFCFFGSKSFLSFSCFSSSLFLCFDMSQTKFFNIDLDWKGFVKTYPENIFFTIPHLKKNQISTRNIILKVSWNFHSDPRMSVSHFNTMELSVDWHVCLYIMSVLRTLTRLSAITDTLRNIIVNKYIYLRNKFWKIFFFFQILIFIILLMNINFLEGIIARKTQVRPFEAASCRS